jgi:ribose 5-phosphate isomerase B
MIGISSDHAGFELKKYLISFLQAQGNKVADYGPLNAEPTPYPLYAKALAKGVLSGEVAVGILICGSGIGMSIAVNRFRGIRAALCLTPEMASLAKAHNNANVLVLGARFISQEQALEICRSFLETSFEGGRHEERIKLIEECL